MAEPEMHRGSIACGIFVFPGLVGADNPLLEAGLCKFRQISVNNQPAIPRLTLTVRRLHGLMLNERLSTFATSTTISLMFFSLLWLQPLLVGLSATHKVAGGVATGLASIGIYRLLAIGILWLFSKWQWLRKVILGRAFIEGTWIGHYMHGNEHRFTIEHIDQSTGATVIRGREFDAAAATRASWASDTVSIDTTRMQLIYAYTCKVFNHKHVQEGLGVFAMVCEVAGEPAQKLDGYAVDLIDGDRDPNTEYKIANTEVSDDFAIAEARKKFNVTKPQTAAS